MNLKNFHKVVSWAVFPRYPLIFMCLFFQGKISAQTDGDIDIPMDQVIAQLETGKVSVLDNNKVSLRNVRFKTGTATLLSSDKIYLDSLSDYLIRIPTVKLVIEGHTDILGRHKDNVKLSQDRADVAAAYLIKKGVLNNQISTKGWGPDKPIDKSNTPEAYEKNRRVELKFKNEQITEPEKEYKIKLTNGSTVNAKFVMFNSDGSIQYKQTNLDTEPYKKLRPAEITSIQNPDGSSLLEPTRIKDISKTVIKTEENKAKKETKPVVAEEPKPKNEVIDLKKEPKSLGSIRAEAYAGATVSYAKGDYIDYQKSFFDVTHPNTEIKGKISPVYFFSLGVQLRYVPFFKDPQFSKLSVSVGAGYYERGFVNRYEATHKDPLRDITDKTVLKETYHLHFLSIPVNVRWGKKWFCEIGLTDDRFVTGKRIHNLTHEVTGSDAYNGGYNSQAAYKETLTTAIARRSSIGVQIGGGVNLNNRFGIRAIMNRSGKTFYSGDDFKSNTFHLQLIILILQNNLNSKV